MFEDLHKELNRVSSRQYKLNITTCIICWSIGLAVFIPLAIYMFCYYASTKIWWLGFVPLFFVFLMSLTFGVGIQWLYPRYKQALQLEKEAEENNQSK